VAKLEGDVKALDRAASRLNLAERRAEKASAKASKAHSELMARCVLLLPLRDLSDCASAGTTDKDKGHHDHDDNDNGPHDHDDKDKGHHDHNDNANDNGNGNDNGGAQGGGARAAARTREGAPRRDRERR